jgi:hypothetical protein
MRSTRACGERRGALRVESGSATTMELVMKLPTVFRLASLLPLAAVLAACAGLPQPFSQIDGHKYRVAQIDTYSVRILRIDGHDTIQSPTIVDPGVREIIVQGPPGGAFRLGEERSLSLNVAPCTRYYLVAQKANRLSSDFTVQVDYQEPIGGCNSTPSK